MSDEQHQARKAAQAKYKRDRREARLKLLGVYRDAVTNGAKLGFRANRLKHSGEVERMPPFMARILKACQELNDNPQRFKHLYFYGGMGVNNRQVRRLLARVLAVLVARSEFVDGRIGVPSEFGTDTITNHSLMADYVLRFGEHIEESTWYSMLKYIKRAGYLQQSYINVAMLNGEGATTVRSAAAYKQLTTQFLLDLKVTFYKNLAQEIFANRRKQEEKGTVFAWLSHKAISDRLREMLAPPEGLAKFTLQQSGLIPQHDYRLSGAPPH